MNACPVSSVTLHKSGYEHNRHMLAVCSDDELGVVVGQCPQESTTVHFGQAIAR